MRRVLITGMSGTGKSAVIRALAGRGHRAVDTDGGGWRVPPDGVAAAGEVQPNWIWDVAAIGDLLALDDGAGGVLFVSGCVDNQGEFYDRFDDVVVLTADEATIVERLRTRAENPFGKDPAELARVLDDRARFEALLLAGATLVVDTGESLEGVVDMILEHVNA